MSKMTDDLLTLQEAAGELRISTKTLRRMIIDGLITPVKLYKSQRIKRQSLLDYLETQNRSK